MADYTKHRIPRMGLSTLFLESATKTRTFNTMMFLVGNDCDSVRMLLKLIYDPRIKFHPDIINKEFTPVCPDNNRDMLYSNVFKVRPFLVGQGYDHLSSEKRQRLWQEYLNILSPEDAALMENFIKHKKSPESRLSLHLVKRYMPELLPSEDEDDSDPLILPPPTPFNGIEWDSKAPDYVPPAKREEPPKEPEKAPEPVPSEPVRRRGRPKKTT